MLGGTCLNIGCIPSKALIHAADEFEKARHYANGSALGIRVKAPQIDLAQTVRWKDGIVGKLTGGVAALLQKERRAGRQGLGHVGRRQDRGRAAVAGRAAAHATASTCCWPPARCRWSCPPCRSAAASSRRPKRWRPRTLPKRLVVVGRRLHRPGAGHRLSQARRGSHRGGSHGARAAQPTTTRSTRPVVATLKRLGVGAAPGLQRAGPHRQRRGRARAQRQCR